MNIREANEFNRVLRYFLNLPGGAFDRTPSREDARQSAEYLAGRANAALMAGLRPSDVTTAFLTLPKAPRTKEQPK